MRRREVQKRAGRVARAIASAAALALAGCESERAPLEREIPPRAADTHRVQTSGINAGPRAARPPLRNPFEGNVHAVAEGKRLYEWMNCAGCHGAIGGGGIGPPLKDRDWIYGAAPANVYQSILQGRPNGMPAFRDRLPEESVWKLVAFVRAMGGAPADEEPGAAVRDVEEDRRAGPRQKPPAEAKPPRNEPRQGSVDEAR